MKKYVLFFILIILKINCVKSQSSGSENLGFESMPATPDIIQQPNEASMEIDSQPIVIKFFIKNYLFDA